MIERIIPMKTFSIKITAYGYITEFKVKALDDAEHLENAIVDKLGENDIKWEYSDFYDQRKKWITFEEIHDATLDGPIQAKKVLGVELGTGTS